MELTYRAFGLTFGSELVLPGLPTTADHPIIRICRGSVPEWQGKPTVQYGERFRIRAGEHSVHYKGLPFSALVRNGDSIQFEANRTHDELASLHILGSCMGALLFQRGLVPLHGNSIETPQGAAILVGRIGSGKSTTTLALTQRGYRLIADDISALSFDNGDCRVMPGFPRLKLWKTTLEQFGMDYGPLSRIRPSLDKFQFPVDAYCDEPRRPHAIYVLQPSDFPDVRLRALTGVAKLQALRAHLYKIRFLDALRVWPSMLEKICRVVDNATVCMVERPREGMTIDGVADVIAGHMSQTASSLSKTV